MSAIYRDATLIAHGYTVASAARIAHVAANSVPRRAALDREDRHAIALCAIVAELNRRTDAPDTLDLVRVGARAVDQGSRHDASSQGRNTNSGYGRTYQVGFTRWAVPGASTPLDETVAERVACRQIVAAMTERQQQVLRSLAQCDGDPKRAAALLGITPSGVSAHMHRARAAFLALWHEHETPPQANWSRGRSYTFSPEGAAAQADRVRRLVQTRQQMRTSA